MFVFVCPLLFQGGTISCGLESGLPSKFIRVLCSQRILGDKNTPLPISLTFANRISSGCDAARDGLCGLEAAVEGRGGS